MNKYKIKTKMINHQKMFKVFAVLAALFLLLSILPVTGVQAQDKTHQRNRDCDCTPDQFITVGVKHERGGVKEGIFKCGLHGNKEFRFVGANAREMVHLFYWIQENHGLDDNMAAQVLYDELKTAADMGVNVLRVYLTRATMNTERYSKGGTITNPAIKRLFHAEAKKVLQYLMDFATKNDLNTEEDPPGFYGEYKDYRPYRPSDLPPPAPNMKFLVCFIDSIKTGADYDSILGFDSEAYGRPDPDPTKQYLHYLDYSWFEDDYQDNYKPLVRYIVTNFRYDPRIFAWELGNEFQAEDATVMSAFINDMVDTIRIYTDNRIKRLVTTGFISAHHACNGNLGNPPPQDPNLNAPSILYNSVNDIDFGCIHIYNDESTHTDIQEDIKYFIDNGKPYIVGELGFDRDVTYGNYFQGNSSWSWDEFDIKIEFENNELHPRTNNILMTLGALYDQLGADGVLQWAFFSNDYDYGIVRDTLRGMDKHHHDEQDEDEDWEGLFNIYQSRANSLRDAICGNCLRLVNPSFEIPSLAPDEKWQRVNDMSGWTGMVDVHQDLPAANGTQVVDLNHAGQGYIEQSFHTHSLQLYVLRFYHGVNYHCTNDIDERTFKVIIRNERDGTEYIWHIDESKREVQCKELQFIPTGNRTTVRFESDDGYNCGATIDNVEICQVRN